MCRYSALLVVVLAGLLALVGVGTAQDGAHPGMHYGMYYGDMSYGCGMMGGGMMGGMLCGMTDGYDWNGIADELNLSQDQRDQLMEHNRQTARDMLADRNELSMKMFDLSTELRSAKPDQAKIDKLVDDISAVQKRILEGRITAITNMRQMMTADQWSKFRHMNMMGWERQDYAPMMERGRGMGMMH